MDEWNVREMHEMGQVRSSRARLVHEFVQAADDDLDAHDDGPALALLDQVEPSANFVRVEAEKCGSESESAVLVLGVMRGEEEVAHGFGVEDAGDLEGGGDEVASLGGRRARRFGGGEGFEAWPGDVDESEGVLVGGSVDELPPSGFVEVPCCDGKAGFLFVLELVGVDILPPVGVVQDGLVQTFLAEVGSALAVVPFGASESVVGVRGGATKSIRGAPFRANVPALAARLASGTHLSLALDVPLRC